MRFKKTLCGITAALTMLSSVAVTAQAEETKQLTVLSESVYKAKETYYIQNYGGGYFGPSRDEDDKSRFFYIGEKELAKWRETGEFTYTDIESDFDPNGYDYMHGNFEGGYVQFAKKDAAGNVTERQVVHVDKAAGKISKAYTLPADWCYTIANGYSVSFRNTDSELSVDVYDPVGKKTTKTLKYTGSDKLLYSGLCVSDSEDLGFVWFVSKPTVTVKTGDKSVNAVPFEIYTIKKNGELELTYSKEEPCVQYGLAAAEENCFLFLETEPGDKNLSLFVYSTEQNKKYPINTYFKGSNDSGSSWSFGTRGLGSKLYGNKVIVKGVYDLAEDDNPLAEGYILANLRDNGDTEAVSKLYKNMSTNDGEIFLVQTLDGKWGYIDSNGKELLTSNAASEFIGDYAVIIGSSLGYIIDRNMNYVSGMAMLGNFTGGESYVSAISDGLFVANGNFVTYGKPIESEPTSDTTSEPTSDTTSEPTSDTTSEPTSDTTSEPTSDTTSEPTSSTTSEPTSSTTQPGENPPTGAALVLLPIVIASGAVAVVSRKRRK